MRKKDKNQDIVDVVVVVLVCDKGLLVINLFFHLYRMFFPFNFLADYCDWKLFPVTLSGSLFLRQEAVFKIKKSQSANCALPVQHQTKSKSQQHLVTAAFDFS